MPTFDKYSLIYRYKVYSNPIPARARFSHFSIFIFFNLQYCQLKTPIIGYERFMKNYKEIIFGDSRGIPSHLLMFGHLRSTPVADYRLTTGAAHFISFEDDNKRH